MGNQIYKQHGSFSYMYVCVDVVHFIMSLIKLMHHKKYTCLHIVQFFHLYVFHTYMRFLSIKVHGHVRLHDIGI
jgi:hypothetical protein